ncbi:MAG: hypothetical protein U5K99_05505 [Anaerolineales bacterium]|nr:hypothetical protein [Anaerolineales bacterium]
MIAPVKNILPLTSIHRERVLPVLGHVVARRLQKVSPDNVIVEAQLKPEYILLNIAQGLNVSPDRADELLQRMEGDELAKGDVIAGPVGLFQRVIRAPYSGIIRIAGEGKVLFEKTSEAFELLAGMEGTVTSIIPERGAIIETRGVLIQGVWGNGKITYGVLNTMSGMLFNEIQLDQLDISHRGSVVAGGYCTDPAVLENAESVPVKGLILGSMSASLIPVAESMNYPIILIDGFGSRPMNPAAAKLLASNHERDVSVHAQVYDPYQGNHPEITISMPVSEDKDYPPEAADLTAGKNVYITTGPSAGMTGTIDHLYPEPYTLPNGVKTRAAQITFDRDDPQAVPLRNLMVLNQ